MKNLTITIDSEDEKSINFILNYIAASINKGQTGHISFPAYWKLEKNEEKKSKPIFVVFDTDINRSKKSRVFLGVFESPEQALEEAFKKDYSQKHRKIEIIKTELNKLGEI